MLLTAAFCFWFPPAACALMIAGSLAIARACVGSIDARAPRSLITPSSDSICVVNSPVAAR